MPTARARRHTAKGVVATTDAAASTTGATTVAGRPTATVVPYGFLDKSMGVSDRDGQRLREALAGMPWRDVTVLLHEPFLVVLVLEHVECEPQFLDGVEGIDTKRLFLESAIEALGYAVALGLCDE
jgi:hypothetical protein